MTRVLVVATSVIVRAGLEALVTNSSALTVVGSSPSLPHLAEQIEGLQPDVVLLETEVQDEETLAYLVALNAEPEAPAFVLLADDLPTTWVAEALRSGVRAVLPQDATANEIVAAVEAAAVGLTSLHMNAVESLLPVLPSVTRNLPSIASQALTPREVEVLSMIAEGLGNKAIARRLNISEHTVKFHIGSIFSKLNASSRTEAVTLGARQGLIML